MDLKMLNSNTKFLMIDLALPSKKTFIKIPHTNANPKMTVQLRWM